MANLPIKILKDEDQNPFIPFVPANAVLLNGSTYNWEEAFANRYTKSEVDAKFEALGTIMEFKGTVPTVGDLPITATNGDVYLVGTNDPEAFIYIDGVWEDLGKMVDLSAYSTTTEVQSLINSAIATERDNTTVAINNAMNNAVALAKDYTDDEIPTKTSDLVNDNQFITIQEVPDQVNSDWNSTSGKSQILNKPIIPVIDPETTIQGNTFNTANKLVKLDGSGKLPAIDGSNLTNLPSGGGGISVVRVNVATPNTTTAKLGTTVEGTYTPAVGDELVVTFENGNFISSPTLEIDSSGAKPIKLGSDNVTNIALTGGTVRMWYDGTNYQMYGSQRLFDYNTVYPEITEAEIIAGTASAATAISGRRMKFALDSRLSGYTIVKDGTDGAGIINFKTE